MSAPPKPGEEKPQRCTLIDAPCKAKAAQSLAECASITIGTLFPDLVGLGRFFALAIGVVANDAVVIRWSAGGAGA